MLSGKSRSKGTGAFDKESDEKVGKEAEELIMKMTEAAYESDWIQVEDGSWDCRVSSKVLPAVRVSTNGRKTFYNQVIAAYTGWVDKRNSYGQAVRFGDGSEIPS